jgi:L-fucose mutarotase
MLKTKLLHPEILMELARNGHGSKVLIADGNFPISTCTPASAKKVYLNLAPGMLSVTDVLIVLKDYIPIESAVVMVPKDEAPQAIHEEFQEMIGEEISFKALKRFEFYEQAKSDDVCLAIATGEVRRFANLLIEIGVVRTEAVSVSTKKEIKQNGIVRTHI